MQPVAGYVLDAVGTKIGFGIFALAWSLVCAAAALATGWQSLAFFRALLGEQVDAGIRYFTQKAESVDRNQYGNIAVEVLIDLLTRVGRHEAALQEFAKRLPPDARLMGIAPSMLELSQRLGSFDTMRELCAERNDLLGYTAALIQPEKTPA